MIIIYLFLLFILILSLIGLVVCPILSCRSNPPKNINNYWLAAFITAWLSLSLILCINRYGFN